MWKWLGAFVSLPIFVFCLDTAPDLDKWASFAKDEQSLLGVLRDAMMDLTPQDYHKLIKKLLIDKNWDTRSLNAIGAKSLWMYEGYTILHFACLGMSHRVKTDKSEYVQVLLNAGMNPDTPTSDGEVFPLHVASAHGNAATVKVLLAGGANPTLNNGVRMSATTLAAKGGTANNLEVLRVFKNAGGSALKMLTSRDGANRNGFGTEKPWSPLLYGVRNFNVPLIHFLIFEVGWGDTKLAEAFAVFEDKQKDAKQKLDDKQASMFRTMLRNLGDTTTDLFKKEKEGYLAAQSKKDLAREADASNTDEL